MPKDIKTNFCTKVKLINCLLFSCHTFNFASLLKWVKCATALIFYIFLTKISNYINIAFYLSGE